MDLGFYVQKPALEKPQAGVQELFKSIGVQGIVYCKIGDKLFPLRGAVARVTCTALDKKGYEANAFTVLSKPSDKKGYFFATLPISEQQSKAKLYDCKTFLNSSPLKTCNVPTDVNNGLTGAFPYSSYHLLSNRKMKLYSVGPFVYDSNKSKLVNGGH